MADYLELYSDTWTDCDSEKRFPPDSASANTVILPFRGIYRFRNVVRVHIPVPHYGVRISLVLCGIAVLGFGDSLSVIANVIMNSGEAFVKAIADKSGKKFGNVKIGFDVCCVVLSVGLSLVLFGGKIVGTREGTVLTALLMGMVVNFFVKRISSPINAVLSN